MGVRWEKSLSARPRMAMRLIYGIVKNLRKRARHRRVLRKKPHKTQEGRLNLALAHHAIGCFIDVGANVGQTGRMLREAGYRGDIISFEPLESAHAKLRATAANDNRWSVAPRMALGSEDGWTTINVSDVSDMSSVRNITAETLRAIPRARVIRQEKVELHRLDSVIDEFVGDEHVKLFLKVDTQGYEREVLDGCEGIIERLTGIKVEISLAPLYYGEATYEYHFDWMKRHGFRPWLVEPVTFSKVLHRHFQIDGVFFREGGAA